MTSQGAPTMSDPTEAKREEAAEEEARTIRRWFALSELLVPRRLRRERGPRVGDVIGRKGGERESEPGPDPDAER
jgi:hypothetical protein